jgi:hypothetical protein
MTTSPKSFGYSGDGDRGPKEIALAALPTHKLSVQ